jgi:hypothetical protein
MRRIAAHHSLCYNPLLCERRFRFEFDATRKLSLFTQGAGDRVYLAGCMSARGLEMPVTQGKLQAPALKEESVLCSFELPY